jgi:hypothetical protein
MSDFVVFILTNGRPDNVHTARSLRNHGYTGKIIVVIDDEDKTAEEYLDKFEDVEIFSKKEIAQEFDEADNFEDRRAIVYARNACFKIAEKLGFKYFMQMDDDYTRFEYRVYTNERQKPSFIANLDAVFAALLNFYQRSNFSTISMAQGGDFIGGKHNRMARKPTLFRKCMNSFICSTDRPFKFIGRINEDVNTYVNKQSIGLLMGTIPFVSLVQNQTQSNKGGMTEMYLDSGTYIKSFYTIMFSPSSVYIKPMGDKHLRLHHHVKWNNAVPKLIAEKHKKTER